MFLYTVGVWSPISSKRMTGEGQSLHRRGRALVQWRWNLNPSFVHPSIPPSINLFNVHWYFTCIYVSMRVLQML